MSAAGSAAELPLWQPSAERIARSQLVRFHRGLVEAGVGPAGPFSYEALHRWSVEEPAAFWAALWRYAEVRADLRDGRAWDEVVVGLDRMEPPDPVRGPRWFTGARLNYAENLLRHDDDRPAVISWTECGPLDTLTHAELRVEIARMAAALRASGVEAGDRVAGFLPNTVHAVIAMLATASLGAIWSSCSPDFGVKGVLDRFGQIEPRVLIVADGYRYAGKSIDCLERTRAIAESIPAIRQVVIVPLAARLGATPSAVTVRDAVTWDAFLASAPSTPLTFVRLPFDHPLAILYSSGTTGLPKCMVHGAGGTLLQHLKEHLLHTDLGPEDRLFYFTTCGWMMWNWLVGALATGATIVLYDGAPMAPALRTAREEDRPGPDLLWEMAAQEGVTVFGTSAKYLALAEKEGIRPRATRDLGSLRTVLSTGSPLAPASFDYVYREIGADVHLASISGGTDIVSCFVLGNPVGPVWRGELQVPGLGMRVDTWGEDGRPIRGTPGELVCTMPFPSMPVAFWNDPDGSRYRAAYFARWPGVWCHGDWAEWTAHGGMIITGRSDATLNPGGVRIGSAELYRQVEQVPEVIESLVIGQEVGTDAARDVRIVLFVRLRAGLSLDAALEQRIRQQIRANTSPHHVPRVIVQVNDLPRTISGKISELAVRDIVHGRPVRNTDALANPEALALFKDLPELAVP